MIPRSGKCFGWKGRNFVVPMREKNIVMLAPDYARVVIRDSSKLVIFYLYKICKQCKWIYSSNLHSSFNIRVNSLVEQFFWWNQRTYSRFVIRDSRFVAIHENSLSNRMDPNYEWRMWTTRIFSLHFANYIRITNYTSRIANTRIVWPHPKSAATLCAIRDSWQFKTRIFYSYKIGKQCNWTYSFCTRRLIFMSIL